MAIRVLCAGDIHIGRRSSRVREAFRSANAWKDIVDQAIELQVDLVALSGDIIDKESKSYEALGPMQHGLAQLGEAGIETVAVAGNHDYDVLLRLASITGTDHFHVLGVGSQWERFTLIRDDVPLVHVDGWSFSKEHIRQAPLHSYVTHPKDDVPVIGLLHGDLGVNDSPYAPINIQELWAAPFSFTLLGHIHLPQVVAGPAGKQVLYPGSPYALDPGETGIHGCWLAEIHQDSSVGLLQIPLSPVQYISGELDLEAVVDETEFQGRLSQKLNAIADEATQQYGSDALEVVSVRLHCTGTSSAHRMVDSWIAQALSGLGQFQAGAIHIEVDRLTSSVRPTIDLNERASGTDPVAETAKIILALDEESPSAPYANLIESTMREMRAIYGHSGYANLRSTDAYHKEPEAEAAREILRSRAWEMLSLLVSQEEQV